MPLSLAGFPPPLTTAAHRRVAGEVAFALIWGAAVFASVLWLPVVLRDSDTLWHITTGDWILSHGAVPTVDTFSFSAAGRPWVAHEWLSEVILALAYRAAAWNGLMVLTGLTAGATIGIVAFYVRRHMRIDLAAMLVMLTISCGGLSLLTRPHMIALPVLALWTMVLVSARMRGAAPSFLLLPLMTLWANLHGGFLVGLVLAGALAIEAAFDPACRRSDWIRSWGLFTVGAVVAAVFTPHGVDGLLFPFRLMAMENLYSIQEWKPMDLGHLTGVTVTILVGLYLGLTGSLRLPRFRVLLVAGLLFTTMQHVRNAQVFGVMVPLLIADGFGPSRAVVTSEWVFGGVVSLIAVLSLCFRIGFPLERTDEGSYVSAALASVPVELRDKPVLNEYGFGGLMIFSGIKPFIDGRADLYGNEMMGTYLSIVHAKGDVLDDVLCRYDIAWTMFGPDTVVPALMDRTPGWHRLYSDKVAIIHVRDAGTRKTACPDRTAN
jgi:fumarate reductase subunit D